LTSLRRDDIINKLFRERRPARRREKTSKKDKNEYVHKEGEILLKHINQFSESTLAQLEKDHQHVFYVYCLMDPRNDECFID